MVILSLKVNFLLSLSRPLSKKYCNITVYQQRENTRYLLASEQCLHRFIYERFY